MVDYRLQTAPNKGGSLYITIDDPERDSHVAAFIPVEDLLLKIREIHSLDGFCSTCQSEPSKSRCQLPTDEPEQPPKKSNLWLGVAILLIGAFLLLFPKYVPYGDWIAGLSYFVGALFFMLGIIGTCLEAFPPERGA
jgi:hypothetical protein